MIRNLIWFYIFGGVFTSAMFLREYQDFANLMTGILLLVSALVVYNKRNEIESWVSGKGKKD
jgi:cell division protein FtsW (lipid II flippase)